MNTVLGVVSISTLTVGVALACLGSALGAGLVLALVYWFVHRHTQVRASILLSILLIGPAAGVIVLVVGNSLAKAVTVGGGIALIRYRSTLDDPKDLVYLFISLAIGMCCGIGYIGFAILATVIFAIVMIVSHLTGFDQIGSKKMKLKIMIPESMNYADTFEGLLKDYCKSYSLAKIKTADYGTLLELTYHIQMKDVSRQKEMLDELRVKNGNLDITLIQNSLEK